MKKNFILLLSFFFSFLSAGEPKKIADLEKWKQDLILAAKKVRENAYEPYSKYKVGAAILTDSGKTFVGTNVENASYGLTICAERSAVFAAISSASKDIKAVAVVTRDGGSPCGACRQVLNEFNPDMIVITSDEAGTKVAEYTLKEILMDSFGPKNVK